MEGFLGWLGFVIGETVAFEGETGDLIVHAKYNVVAIGC